MKRCCALILCGSLAVLGCDKKKEAPVKAPPPPPREPISAIMPSPLDGNPADVLVDIDGKTLTRADATAEIEFRLSGMLGRIPPEQLNGARNEMLGTVLNQFVMRTLLMNEADRRQITVSKQDEEKAYDDIRKQLPPGMTLEEVMKNSPRGEEAMRSEVLVGIKVRKLLDPMTTNDVAITDSETDEFIKQNGAGMDMPETVTASHILIATTAADNEAAKADKRKKAEGLQKQLADGADFAALATESSDCPSKEQGGDLGSFTRDRMVKPFSDAAFAQKVGEIGPVVETQFGYHIIKVTEHTPAGAVPREKIVEILKNQKRQKAVGDFIDGLRGQASIKFHSSMGATQSPSMAP